MISLINPDLCIQAVLDAASASGKRRVLLSGSLWPQWLDQITLLLQAQHLSVNEPDPDPLGFENLVSSVSPDMICVIVQNPSFFGNIRDLTALKSECREWEVPLFVLGKSQPPCAHAQTLSAKLHQLPGVRLITDDFTDRFSLYLGEDNDSATILEILQEQGIDNCESAALAYPSYPELRPVLIVNTPVDGEKLTKALRDALALTAKHR